MVELCRAWKGHTKLHALRQEQGHRIIWAMAQSPPSGTFSSLTHLVNVSFKAQLKYHLLSQVFLGTLCSSWKLHSAVTSAGPQTCRNLEPTVQMLCELYVCVYLAVFITYQELWWAAIAADSALPLTLSTVPGGTKVFAESWMDECINGFWNESDRCTSGSHSSFMFSCEGSPLRLGRF